MSPGPSCSSGASAHPELSVWVHNVLCGRHNNALSPLDEEAARFFRLLRAFEQALREGNGNRRIAMLAGVDLERWLLKALMGMMSAGFGRTTDGNAIEWSAPSLWQRIVFGEVGFPSSWGLYVSGRLGDSMQLNPGDLSMAPLTTEEEVSGCVATFAGARFALVLRDVGAARTGGIDDDSIRRPHELLFQDLPTSTRQSLCFTWSSTPAPGSRCFALSRERVQVVLDWSRDGKPPPPLSDRANIHAVSGQG